MEKRHITGIMLGFVGNFLYAENLEAGRLRVLRKWGFLTLENIGTMPPVIPAIRRIPYTSCLNSAAPFNPDNRKTAAGFIENRKNKIADLYPLFYN